MRLSFRSLLVPWFAGLALACFGGGDETPPPPTEPATSTAAAEVSPTPLGPPPTPFPTRVTSKMVPSTVWLIDTRDGSVISLHESHEVAAVTAFFDEGNAHVITTRDFEDREIVTFDLEGQELRRAPWGVWGDCLEMESGVEVDGRQFADVRCGRISPDGKRMVYGVQTGSGEIRPGYEVPSLDYRVLELETGEDVLLQQGLLACQADSIFAPEWSASSRFVYFGDCAQEGRVFVGDAETGTVRQVASHLPTYSLEPSWSPVGDVLLYAGEGGVSIKENMASGAREELPDVSWPVRFEPSGGYFFSVPDRDTPNETRVYDATTSTLVATLPGTAVYEAPLGFSIGLRFVPLASVDGGFVAALDEASGCDGTALYRNQALVRCVERAYGPAISPDGAQVVLARWTGDSGPVEGLGFGSVSMRMYEVLLVDTTTGAETVVTDDALGSGYPAPMFWNEEGTHILVVSPFAYGP